MNMRKGVSPLIAAVILIAFTMTAASLFGPWASDMLQNTQEGQTDRAETIQSATQTRLDVSNVLKNGSKVQINVRQTGSTDFSNYSVIAKCGGGYVVERFDNGIPPGGIENIEVEGCNGTVESVEVQSEDMPVEETVEEDEVAVLPMEPFNLTISGSMSDKVAGIAQTENNGALISGITQTYASGPVDGWLVKINRRGEVVWNKSYGGAGGDTVRGLKEFDGVYYMAGMTNSYGTGTTAAWLLGVDRTGEVIENLTYGGTDADTFYDVEKYKSGEMVMVGETQSYSSNSNSDAWVVKTDETGNVKWNKSVGGLDDEALHGVETASSGGVLAVGKTSSYGGGNKAGWLLKFDSSGNLVVNKTFGGSGYDEFGDIDQLSNGNYLITGTDLETWARGWLLEFDSSGNKVDELVRGGVSAGSSWNFHRSKLRKEGGTYTAGYMDPEGGTDYNLSIVKYGPEFEEIWTKTLSSVNQDITYVEQTSDNGVLFAATRTGSDGTDEIVVYKRDSDGSMD